MEAKRRKERTTLQTSQPCEDDFLLGHFDRKDIRRIPYNFSASTNCGKLTNNDDNDYWCCNRFSNEKLCQSKSTLVKEVKEERVLMDGKLVPLH